MAKLLPRLIVAMLTVGFLSLAAIVGWKYLELLKGQPGGTSGQTTVLGDPDQFQLPTARDASYVGSQVCRECHEQIYDDYRATPMGQSMAATADAEPIENFTNVHFEPGGEQHYEVIRDGDKILHKQITMNADDEPTLTQAEEICHIVGSGQRGRTYLVRQGDRLFQSPIGWYAQGNRWDLSPGYAPENHAGFERAIGDSCLYCHAGRTNTLEHSSERYHPQALLEASISCERCHGPGDPHVQYHREEAQGKDPIVNPANLDPYRRESICYQCHLMGDLVITRKGRGFFDFRPGDRLEDSLVILRKSLAETHGKSLRAVSQVEQMQQSTCFQKSDGRFGCTSCHDPHRTAPKDNLDAYYRDKCLQCHQTEHCPEDMTVRNQTQDSCIACHMPQSPAGNVPHTSFTDHRVPRHKETQPVAAPPTTGAEGAFHLFGMADQTLTREQIARALGIAQTSAAKRKRDRHLAAAALEQLELSLPAGDAPLAERLSWVQDTHLLSKMADCYALMDVYDLEQLCWQRVLEVDPEHESALFELARTAELQTDFAAYREYTNRLFQLDPWSRDVALMRLKVLQKEGQIPEALAYGEEVLQRKPKHTLLRQQLRALYQQEGDTESAQRHAKILDDGSGETPK